MKIEFEITGEIANDTDIFNVSIYAKSGVYESPLNFIFVDKTTNMLYAVDKITMNATTNEVIEKKEEKTLSTLTEGFALRMLSIAVGQDSFGKDKL